MKVWISKYALTQGIFEVEVEITKTNEDMLTVKQENGIPSYYFGEGKDWHRDKETAIRKAEELKDKKIKSLKKQIEKLENLKFE